MAGADEGSRVVLLKFAFDHLGEIESVLRC